jgi:hypothetical protein
MFPHIRQSISEASFLIDIVASIRYSSFVPELHKVVDALKSGVKRDVKLVEQSKRELEELEEMAERIYSLQRNMEHAEIRVIRTLELLRDKSLTDSVAKSPEFRRIHERLRLPKTREVSLRAAMQEYLRIAKKAKVAEIVEFLQTMGFDYAKRQTIEGVIKRHPFDFKVVKDGREKFITVLPE